MIALLSGDSLADQTSKVNANLFQHACMLHHSLHTRPPLVSMRLQLRHLPSQDRIKVIYMLLCPLDACRRQQRCKGSLKDTHSVCDECKVNVRELREVVLKVAAGDALTVLLTR